MGQYLNPTAAGFARSIKSGKYVDKTGLIAYMNGVLDTDDSLVCSTRPRRFGKSYAAQMLAAYYSRNCDSRELFKGLKISQDPSFECYLNQCDVLFLDILWFIGNSRAEKMPLIDYISSQVCSELLQAFPEINGESYSSLAQLLLKISLKTQRKFIIIIDEWDAVFREFKHDTALQEQYISFLRMLFKGSQVPHFILGAYMTGILPIKKYGTQSALTDFKEFTMISSRELAEFVGFTKNEVISLCDKYHMDSAKMKYWYDGYVLKHTGHVFCPNSVINAITSKEYGSYWTQSDSYTSLQEFIDLNFNGLKDAVISMLGGFPIHIDATTFLNDLTSLRSKDDVLTLLVHLGYLGYDAESQNVFIPNEEIRREFIKTLKSSSRDELFKIIKCSDRVLDATLKENCDELSELIGKVHDYFTVPEFYNNEQALRSVVRLAYLSAVDAYTSFEEIAAGKGYVDLLFVPRKDSMRPALIVELKWDRSSEQAIQQIKDRGYAEVLKKFDISGNALLVGIAYDAKNKKHSCSIERLEV